MKRSITERRVQRLSDADQAGFDRVAVEEPLEIRLAGDPLAITMRTPGEDRFLAVGFLFAEGIVESIDDIGKVTHCGRLGQDDRQNVLDVLPAPGTALPPLRIEGSRRGTLTTAACGVCGRKSIDDLLERVGVIERDIVLDKDVLARAPDQLAKGQLCFAHTGGVHAAAALAANGEVLALAEDVGRHNAVDKVLGKLLYERRIPGEAAAILAVSGRVSFEIVQKAAAARIPAVAAISAPTSLAIDLAERAGITLAAFVRQGRLNLYAHPERVR